MTNDATKPSIDVAQMTNEAPEISNNETQTRTTVTETKPNAVKMSN